MTHDLLKALEARREAIRRDEEAWFLRELAVAQWCADSVFPQAIERWVRQIGEQVPR